MEDDRSRWNGRHAEAPLGPPSDFLGSCLRVLLEAREQGSLPPGPILDLAGGTGRHALGFLQAGFEVLLVDVSDVALDRAQERARQAGVEIPSLRWDLSRDGLPPTPAAAYFSFHFYEPRLFPQIREALPPGGWFFFCQPTLENLTLHPRPSRRFLLDPAHLPELTQGLKSVSLEVGPFESRMEARGIFQGPSSTAG